MPRAPLRADTPMTCVFVTVTEAFVAERDLDPVPFEPGERENDLTRVYLRT